MYEPSLVALNLEVCSDALQVVQKSGTQTIAGPLARPWCGWCGSSTRSSSAGPPGRSVRIRRASRPSDPTDESGQRASRSGWGVDGHGIPEACQRRDRRADHRTEAGSHRDRPFARACHIVLDPNGVSRRHAEIYRKGEEFFLADLNSRNMTKVNNTKVIPGIDHRLSSGRPDQYLRRRVPVLSPAAVGQPDKEAGGHHDRQRGRQPDSRSCTPWTPRARAPWRAW